MINVDLNLCQPRALSVGLSCMRNLLCDKSKKAIKHDKLLRDLLFLLKPFDQV